MFSKTMDTVFLCEQCGTMHVRDNGKTETINYEFGEFVSKPGGDRIYLPFWAVDVSFNITNIEIKGGTLGNLFGGGQQQNGRIMMFMPAYEIEPTRFKDVAMNQTHNPPKYKANTRPEPGVLRERCVLTSDLLPQMVDFIFVTSVAEKPGVLQRLDYTLSIAGKWIVYLPHYKKGDGKYEPGY